MKVGVSLPCGTLGYLQQLKGIRQHLSMWTSARTATVAKSTIPLYTGNMFQKHHFKVNDILNDGTTGATITGINTYDTIAVDAAYAEGF